MHFAQKGQSTKVESRTALKGTVLWISSASSLAEGTFGGCRKPRQTGVET